MTEPLLYRSIIDGWRVGVATNVANTSKVTVDDVETGLSETVTPQGIYVPRSTELLTAPRTFYTQDDDVASLVPSPLESLPTLLHAMRCRHAEGKDGVLIGDNTLIYNKGQGSDSTHLAFARRLTASMRASPNVSQRVNIVGDGASYDLFASLSAEIASSMHGLIIPEALAALRPFCTTSRGESLAVASLEIFPGVGAARLHLSMLDYGALNAPHGGAGFSIFGYMIHGCSHDEKNECCLPVTDNNFRAHPASLSSATVEACRVGFLRFRKALDAMRMEPYAQTAMLSRVSAALQLLQIDFDEDGVLLTTSAVKNTARALRVDYEQLKGLLTTRRHTFVLASYLLRATIVSLVRRINNALNPAGAGLDVSATAGAGSAPSSVSVNLMPSSEHLGDGPRRLLVEVLHEDLAQCVFRSSEREILQWQRCGFAVTPALQHVFDAVDNYSLLKVLRGVGGVLTTLSAPNDQVAGVLERVGRHRAIQSDPKALTLTIRHSNDKEVAYSRLNSGGYPTMEDGGEFGPLKDYVLSGADADCQEAFMLTEQLGPIRSSTALCDLDDLSRITAKLSDASTMHWWAYDVSPPSGGTFEGFFIEQSLIEHRVRPFTMLRQLLPRRFLPCEASFIAKEFEALCDGAARAQTSVAVKAEGILTSNNVHYLVAKGSLLVEARSTMQLYAQLEEHVHRNVCLIQAAVRSKLAGLRLSRRVTMLQEAIGMVVRTIDEEDSRYRHQLNSQDLHRVEVLNVQEMEQGGRAAIRDACWVEWVALQTEERAALEEAIERQVARRIRDDEQNFKSIVRQREANALEELAARVQERILLQGAHLDGIVVSKNSQLQGARKQLETTRRVHERRLGMMVTEEERRADTQNRILHKNTVAKTVAVDRLNKASVLREEMWSRHERDRLARMELQRARDGIAERMREKFVMEGIEAVVAKRVAAEVTERNRRVREAEEAAMRNERAERERELRDLERKQAAQSMKQTKQMERSMFARDSERAKQQYRQWTAQEKERQAVLRLQKEEQKQNKKLTSALLQAHSLLSNPQLFDINGNMRSSSRSRYQDPGFSLSGGATSYTRLLPNSSVDAVVSFHQARSPTPYKNRRAFSPSSDYSL